MTIQEYFNTEPTEAFVQDIERDGQKFQVIPIDKIRYMLNTELVSWGTEEFYISMPYIYEGDTFVNSSCVLFGELFIGGRPTTIGEYSMGSFIKFRYVGVSTFRPKDFVGNHSLAQIGLAEATKNAAKNLGKKWGRDLNQNSPSAEMMLELVIEKTENKKRHPSMEKEINKLVNTINSK